MARIRIRVWYVLVAVGAMCVALVVFPFREIVAERQASSRILAEGGRVHFGSRELWGFVPLRRVLRVDLSRCPPEAALRELIRLPQLEQLHLCESALPVDVVEKLTNAGVQTFSRSRFRGEFTDLTFVPGAPTLLAGSFHGIHVLDFGAEGAADSLVHLVPDSAERIAISPDAKRVVAVGRNGRVSVFDAGSWSKCSEWELGAPAQQVEFLDTCRVAMVVAGGSRLRVLEVLSGDCIYELQADIGGAAPFTLSADRKTLAWGSGDGVSLHATDTGALIRRWHCRDVHCISLSPENRLVATIEYVVSQANVPVPCCLRIWDIARAECVALDDQAGISEARFTHEGLIVRDEYKIRLVTSPDFACGAIDVERTTLELPPIGRSSLSTNWVGSQSILATAEDGAVASTHGQEVVVWRRLSVTSIPPRTGVGTTGEVRGAQQIGRSGEPGKG